MRSSEPWPRSPTAIAHGVSHAVEVMDFGLDVWSMIGRVGDLDMVITGSGVPFERLALASGRPRRRPAAGPAGPGKMSDGHRAATSTKSVRPIEARYCNVVLIRGGNAGGGTVVSTMGDTPPRGLEEHAQFESLVDVLDVAAADGWELVSSDQSNLEPNALVSFFFRHSP